MRRTLKLGAAGECRVKLLPRRPDWWEEGQTAEMVDGVICLPRALSARERAWAVVECLLSVPLARFSDRVDYDLQAEIIALQIEALAGAASDGRYWPEG